MKLVKDHIFTTEEKIELVESQIQQAKSSLSSLNTTSIISTNKALISLKSYRTLVASKDNHVLVSSGVNSHAEPVSDCDISMCASQSLTEIKPNSDTKVFNAGQPVQLCFEEISDSEMSTFAHDKNQVICKNNCDNCSQSICRTCSLGESRSESVGDSMSSLQSASLATPTSQLLDNIAQRISVLSETQKSAENDVGSGLSCSPVTPHIVKSSIVDTGLFTIENEPPCLSFATSDPNACNTLNVTPTCINTSFYYYYHDKSLSSHIKCSSDVLPSSITTPQSSLNQRTRKQKKPTKRIVNNSDVLSIKLLSTNKISAENDKVAECESSRKRKQSFQSDLDLKRVKSPVEVIEGAKLCVTNCIKWNPNVCTFTPSDRVADVLEQAFKSSIPNCRLPLVVSEVQKLLQVTNGFPVYLADHTCKRFPLCLTHSVAHMCIDVSRLSTVKLPATFCDLPSNTSCTTVGGGGGGGGGGGSVYTTYSSPLLSFNSYLLNPAYRQQEKLLLGSITHSNSINSSQEFCKFELLGVCKDPKCSAQHICQVIPSNKDVVASFVSHAPQIAQITSSEQANPNQCMEQVLTYSFALVDRYSSKLSNEEVYRLVAHKVVKAKQLDDPKYGERYFVTFDDCGQFIKSKNQRLVRVDTGHVCMSNVEQSDIPLFCDSADSHPTSKRYDFLVKLFPVY